MSHSKYRFKLDEKAPKIPAPKDFGALLANVQATKLWYQKSWVWGGTAILTAVVSIAAWYFNPKPQAEVRNTTPKTTEAKLISPVPQPESLPVLKNTSNKSIGILPKIVHSLPPEKQLDEPKQTVVAVKQDSIAIEIAKPQVPASQAVPTHYHWFTLPYDTFTIADNTKSGSIMLKGSSWLQFPANAWVDEENEPADGEIKILYREVRNQAEMLLTGINFQAQQKGIIAPYENNGSFEIQATQNGKPLKLKQGYSLILNFSINSPSPAFSGFQYSNAKQNWERMDISDASKSKNKHSFHPGYLLKEQKGFWAKLKALFKKPEYEALPGKPAEYNAKAMDSKHENSRQRAFEIRSFGWFGSGKTEEISKLIAVSNNYMVNSKDTFLEGVYLVNLTTNSIEYISSNNQLNLRVLPSDQCMLVAFATNRNAIAILNPGAFSNLVNNQIMNSKKQMHKNHGETIVLEMYPKPIDSVEDLYLVLKSFSNKVGDLP